MATDFAIAFYTKDPKFAVRHVFSENNLSQIARIPSVTVLINFVSPAWTHEKVEEIVSRLKEKDIEFGYKESSYEVHGRGLYPFNRMLFDAVSLGEFPFYVLFSEGIELLGSKGKSVSGAMQIVDAVKYLNTYKRCGVVSFYGRTKISHEGIVPVSFDFPVGDGKCFAVRSMKGISPYGFLVPRRSLELVGCGENLSVVSHVLWNGYFASVISNARISLKVNKTDLNGADSRPIVEINNCRFIQDTFNSGYHFLDKGANLVSASSYEEHGGKAITESFRKAHIMPLSETEALLDKGEQLDLPF